MARRSVSRYGGAGILEQAGFEIVGPARTLVQGLDLLRAKGRDAAVLDVQLGRETSEPIALELKKRGIPFVTLSGYSREQYPALFGGAPALAKPIRPELFVAGIKNCLQRHAANG
jgi:DNA-binding response OmpR family regulator